MSIEDDITEALGESANARRIRKRTARNSESVVPAQVSAAEVQEARKGVNASQPVFAAFIGVSTNTVKAWEQGANPVTGAANRLLRDILENPRYWSAKFDKG